MSDHTQTNYPPQSTINNKATDIHNGVRAGLQLYAKRLQDLKPNMYIERHELFNEIKEFLHSLSTVSPQCARQWQSIAQNDQKQLQKLLLELAQDQQVLKDITQTQNYAKQAAAKAQHSKQLNTALAEQQDKVDKMHKASIDSLPHDRMRALGDLMEDLIRVKYLVPMQEEYYPSGFNYKPENTNSYEELLRSKYGDTGDTVYQPAAPKM